MARYINADLLKEEINKEISRCNIDLENYVGDESYTHTIKGTLMGLAFCKYHIDSTIERRDE